MQETFRNLIREGFPMYIWLDGEIVPMTEELIRSLDDVEFRQKITPVSNTELTEQAFIQQRLIIKLMFTFNSTRINPIQCVDKTMLIFFDKII